MINFDALVESRPTDSELIEYIRDPNFFALPEIMHPRVQAKKLDKILGIKSQITEQTLLRKYRPYYKSNSTSNGKEHHEGSQTWIGLHPQVLQTPYSEILDFFWLVRKYEINRVVDLGAGYGRLAIVMKSIFPNATFLGYEIVKSRISEAKRTFERLDLTDCEVRSEDILDSSFSLPKADLYFIYDFSDPKDIKTILTLLSERIKDNRFFLVVRGEGARSLIQLKFPQFWALNGAIHRKNWSLYSTFVELS